MKLTIINGSPKGKKSNTKILTDSFIKGFLSVESNSVIELFLKYKKDAEPVKKAFFTSDCLILAFPLYTDSMPGMVKAYIEDLEAFKGKNPDLKMGFIIQSGFPESRHSTFVSRYLEKVTAILGTHFSGVLIKGGVEGIYLKPKWMTRKMLSYFEKSGEIYGKSALIDTTLKKKLGKPEKLTYFARRFYRIGIKLNMTNFYWNYLLKSNNAYEKRFDKPYEEMSA